MNLLAALGMTTILGAACGSSQKPTEVKPSDPGDKPAITAEDQAFEGYEPFVLAGVRFKPEALEAPSMTMVKPKKRTTLDKQRKLVAKQGSKKKALDVHILVSLLWDAADERAADEAKPLRQEALGLITDFVASLKEPDEVSLQQAAAAEMWAEDDAAAIATYEQLTKRFGSSKGAAAYRTWLAYLYLRADRNADAAAAVEGWDATAEDTSPLAAYVVAWVHFRARDWEAARTAISAAAGKWKGGAGVPALERDVMLFYTRGGATAAEAAEAIVAVGKSAPKAVLLYRLHEGFVFAGHYDQASEVLDMLTAEAIPTDLVSFRYYQSDYEFRQNHPLEAAERAAAANEALAACAECADATKQAVHKRIQDLAGFFHRIYAASFDDSHGKAAKVLYTLYIDAGLPEADQVRSYLANLEQTMAAAAPQNGKHDKELMRNMVLIRLDGIKACYEAVLGSEPELAGDFALTLDIAASGEVEGVTSEPGAGAEGLAAVAGCAADVVKAWRFPSRTVPGRTALVAPFKVSPAE